MIQKILTKTDKWLKIILLFFANVTVIGFTLASIIFLSMSDNQIKISYPEQTMYELIIQMKNAFKILIWFLVPLSILIFIINTWKAYEWWYQKKENKKQKQKEKNTKRR